MLPLGYQMKRIWRAPPGFGPPHVRDVYAVSDCLSESFDSASEVKGNEHGFYASPSELRAFAARHALPFDGFALFYYEAYELEHVDGEPGAHWRRFAPDNVAAATIEPPSGHMLAGFDVAALSGGELPGCSPLSCNGLANELTTNEHCLLPSVEVAIQALESGAFANSEPGPYRIIAVYSVGTG
jgi:hypothetical protein